MYTLYCYPRTSSSRCWWLFKELGVPVTETIVKLGAGEQKSPEYLAINPNGYLPSLRHDDVILTESWAINWYVAETNRPALLGATPLDRARVLAWTVWGALNLDLNLGGIITEKWYKNDDPAVIKEFDGKLRKHLAVLDAHLASRAYLCGDSFMLCDLNVASVLHTGTYIDYGFADFPNVTAWLGRIAALPSYQALVEWDKRQVE